MEYINPKGAYRVTVVADQEWLEYAKLTRKVLNEHLTNADKLTGPQLLDVIRRLKEIAQKMQQSENATGSAGCSGAVSEEGFNAAVITIGADGQLVATCG